MQGSAAAFDVGRNYALIFGNRGLNNAVTVNSFYSFDPE